MFKLFLLVIGFTLCMCAFPHDRIAKIFNDFDYNKNDNINQNEVLAFYHNLKQNPADTLITKATFVRNWSSRYGDTTVVSTKMFENMDMNMDGLLTDADVPIFYSKFDKNRNGIEWAEFETVFNSWYST
ncbi:uncharacterized protein LOC135471902 [Liolophura sinensis]|uniref:uncharacterized protein LOC135471902 n=1 Tax=Liolophura sinensis TaxID=3198878 RepID=UPI003158E48F